MSSCDPAAPPALPDGVLRFERQHYRGKHYTVPIFEHADDPRLGWCARVLLGQAQLADAGELGEPEAYNQAVAELMLRAV